MRRRMRRGADREPCAEDWDVDGREMMKRGRDAAFARWSLCTSSRILSLYRPFASAPVLHVCAAFVVLSSILHSPTSSTAALPTLHSRPRAPSLPARWEYHIKAVPTTTACDSSDRVKDDRPAYSPRCDCPSPPSSFSPPVPALSPNSLAYDARAATPTCSCTPGQSPFLLTAADIDRLTIIVHILAFPPATHAAGSPLCVASSATC
ncbi:hypothetical protein B0H14DRAFT_1318419 [Mycena olivaceomarginata]|nr:hypothetical protein B0H14DRAFT_1318419 [Mycena olivaceomarginata]